MKRFIENIKNWCWSKKKIRGSHSFFAFFIINVFILLLIFYFTKISLGDKLILNYDNRASLLFNSNYIKKNFFLWNNTNGVGVFFSGTNDLPVYYLQHLLLYIFDGEHLLYYQYIIFNILTFYSIFYFFYVFNKAFLKKSIGRYGVLFCSIIAVVNFSYFHGVSLGQLTHIIPFFIMPFSLANLVLYLKEDKKWPIMYFSSFVLLGTNIAHYAVFAVLVIIIILICYLGETQKRMLFRKVLLLLIYSGLILQFVLIPNLFFAVNSYDYVRNNEYLVNSTINSEMLMQREYMSLSVVLRQIISPSAFFTKNYQINPFNYLLYFPMIFYVFSLVWIKKYRVVFVLLFFNLLISIFLFNGSAQPFGKIYDFIITEIPGMVMFRSIHFKWNYIFLICNGCILLLIYSNMKTIKNVLKCLIILCTLVIIIIPFRKQFSKLYVEEVFVKLPENYVQDIKDFSEIAERYKLQNGIILPDTATQWTTRLNSGLDSYSFFSQSTYEYGFFDQGTASSSSFNNIAYNTIKINLKNNDYNNLLKIFEKYRINFFIYQKNFKYENLINDQNSQVEDFISFIIKNGNGNIIYDGEHYTLYLIYDKDALYFGSDSVDIKNSKHYKINPTKHLIELNLKNTDKICFFEGYDKNWKLYLLKVGDKDLADKSIFDLSYLWRKPIFEDTHELVYDYANGWTIDPEYIKANYPPEYYHENPDGSIDIQLTLYFKPQSYFYLGIIISGTTFTGCVIYLVIDTIKTKRRKKDTNEPQNKK